MTASENLPILPTLDKAAEEWRKHPQWTQPSCSWLWLWCTRTGWWGWKGEPDVCYSSHPQDLTGLSPRPPGTQTSITSPHVLQGIHHYFVVVFLLAENFMGKNEEEDLHHAMYLLQMFTVKFSALWNSFSQGCYHNPSLFSYMHPSLPWCPGQFISTL